MWCVLHCSESKICIVIKFLRRLCADSIFPIQLRKIIVVQCTYTQYCASKSQLGDCARVRVTIKHEPTTFVTIYEACGRLVSRYPSSTMVQTIQDHIEYRGIKTTRVHVLTPSIVLIPLDDTKTSHTLVLPIEQLLCESVLHND